MGSNEIYTKTMKFSLIKLGLGLIEILIDIVLIALGVGIGVLTQNSLMIFLGIIFGALMGPALVHYMIAHYIGYMVKAGHVAVITEAVVTGSLPENQIEFAKNAVKEKFASANVYFVIDSLVSKSVRGIQSGIDTFGSILEKLPGGDTVIKIVKAFINVFLGYIDECCLAYTFYKKDQKAFKSACDGVVIYFTNSKKLAVNALKIVIAVVALSFILFTICMYTMAGIVGIFDLGGIATLISVVLALLLVIAVKTAFIDSYILVKMIQSYMEVAPTTEIKVDIYTKLCNLSTKFKELFTKSKSEEDSSVETAEISK